MSKTIEDGFFKAFFNNTKGKKEVQGVPQSRNAALPRQD